MDPLRCELCGSTDIIKKDGIYQCQHCGTKYTVEEAQKLIGKVKIDKSDDIDNLYTLARRAKNDHNYKSAASFYAQILPLDPNSWEAAFYVEYCKLANTPISDIASACQSFLRQLPTIMELISQQPKDKQFEYYKTVADDTIFLGTALESSSRTTLQEFFQTSAKAEALSHYSDNCTGIMIMFLGLGECLEKYIPTNSRIAQLAINAWKNEISIMQLTTQITKSNGCFNKSVHQSAQEVINSAADSIRKYERDFSTPLLFNTTSRGTTGSSQGGCYIATCVYGSYDCPQVWILRRYRDQILANNWIGRKFIVIYYALSPSVVKYFGKASWVRRLWKLQLDYIVKKLEVKGFASTAYQDKE